MKTKRTDLLIRCAALAAALIAAAAFTRPAFAHKVSVFAYVEGETVRAEGYFVDGKPCANTRFEVFDASGAKVMQGTTSADGTFSFKAAKKSDYKLVVNAGEGHQAEYTVKASELPDIKPPAPPKPAEKPAATEKAPAPDAEKPKPAEKEATEKPKEPEAKKKSAPKAEEQQAEAPRAAMDEETIRRIVGEEIDKKIEPLKIALRRQAGPSAGEIAGVIGYIVGAAGLWQLAMSRKRKA